LRGPLLRRHRRRHLRAAGDVPERARHRAPGLPDPRSTRGDRLDDAGQHRRLRGGPAARTRRPIACRVTTTTPRLIADDSPMRSGRRIAALSVGVNVLLAAVALWAGRAGHSTTVLAAGVEFAA